MLRETFTASVLVALAAPAFACPTVADLGQGIEFRTADGDVEVHRQLRPDWVTVTVTFADGDGSVLEFYKGMYLLSVIPIEQGIPKPGAREDYASVAELAEWQRPVPDAAWVNATPGGGQAVAGPMDTIMIAGCRYNSIGVTVKFADDDTYTEVYEYLPDLGVGLLVRTEASDRTDDYSYIAVRALD
ncbi:MAG: hypothetical protein AAFY25_01445 [Pseudomonadota bacterium]